MADGDRRARRLRDEGGGLTSAAPATPAPDLVFAALGDPTRWAVLNLLAERGGGTATTLAGELPVSRVAVVKHLGVLEEVGLVERWRAGREVRFAAQPARLSAVAHDLEALASAWDARLARLKRLAEER